jgi:hypothetical protein
VAARRSLSGGGSPAKTSSEGKFCWSRECGGAIQLPGEDRRLIRAVSQRRVSPTSSFIFAIWFDKNASGDFRTLFRLSKSADSG